MVSVVVVVVVVVPVASDSTVSVTVSVVDSNTLGVQSPETPDGQLVLSIFLT